MNKCSLGWNSTFEAYFSHYDSDLYSVGRVATEHQHLYRLYSEDGEFWGEVAGKLRYQAESREQLPAVGDWVVMTVHDRDRAVIHAVLPRQSKFSRKVAGFVTEEQIVAANMDTVFIVTSLNHDFNLRRLERTLVMVWESGAEPVVVLTKADLCDDTATSIGQVASIAPGVPVHAVSSITQGGLHALDSYVREGRTVALIGSSGVGKSTLINALAGEEKMVVNGVRESDDHGRHTTTHRELIVLPRGGIIMDTPGMRELQLWASDDGLTEAFTDVEGLAEQCFYRDCQHRNEPGCRVKRALEDGTLSGARFQSYLKLQRELAHIARKTAGHQRRMSRATSDRRDRKVHADDML